MSDETPEIVVSAPETEVTTSATTDQPAVPADASASLSSSVEDSSADAPSPPPAEDVVLEPAPAVNPEPSPLPAVEPVKAGGGFDSPFAPTPSAPSMIDRINNLEARIADLEAK